MRLSVSVQGRAGEVEFTREAETCRFRYTSAGREEITGVASIVEVEPGIYSVIWDGRSYEAKVSWANGSGFVDVSGRHYSIQAFDPRELVPGAAAARAGREEIVAPMPGKVVRTLVKEGDQVEAGQGIVVVEAMKMQNEMTAPKSGRVALLRAAPGATVSAGDVLAAIE
jgi:biotin carboxyl carrier protein